MKRIGTRIGAAVGLVIASLLAVPVSGAGAVAPGASPSDRAFVVAAYQDFLGRLPTDEELATATSGPLTTTAERATVVSKLAYSPDRVRVTVEHLYRDTFNREGDLTGVAYWVGMVTSGRMTVADVAVAFYASDEYFTGIGKSDVRTWVRDLYSKILLRPGSSDPSGVAYWVAVTGARGRQTVANAIYQSGESRKTRITALYETLLGRQPELNGLTYWAARIQSLGDLELAEALASSQEYANRAAVRFRIPGAPTDAVTTPGDGTANVAWSAPTDSGGLTISSYTVTSSSGERSCTTDGATSCTVTGLANQANYTFTVAATNLVGTGAASSSTAPVTPPWQTLASPPESVPWAPTALNDSGEIVGNTNFTTGNQRGAACVDPCTAPRMLSIPTGMTAPMVSAVSASGEIVGRSTDENGAPKILAWSSLTANPTILTMPIGLTYLQITGVSSAGEIIGYGSADGTTDRGVVWSSVNATPTIISPPANFSAVQLTAISPAGEIVGFAMGMGLTYEALAWSTTMATPVVLSVPTGYLYPTPRVVNAAGTIVGTAEDGMGAQQALVWTASNKAPTTLGIANGYSDPYGWGISTGGSITGGLTGSSGEAQGAIWATPTAPPQLLAQPAGYISTMAAGVRPDGSIVGFGADPADVTQALTWASPTASPSLLPVPHAITDVTSVVGSSTGGATAGNGKGGTDSSQAFLWSSPDHPTVTLDAPGYPSMSIAGVGQVDHHVDMVVGSAYDGSHVSHALAWPSTASTPTLLQVPPGYTASQASVVAASGVIYGAGTDASGTQQGLMWSSLTAAPAVLADPYGYAEPYQTGFKVAVTQVSSTGAIVGSISDDPNTSTALVWASASATPTYLQVLGSIGSVAAAISANGVIVGSSVDFYGHSRGVVWTSASADPVMLAAPVGDTSVWATGITSTGVIVGYGTNAYGASEGLMWRSATATPTVLASPPGVMDVVVMGATPDGIIFGTARGSDRIGIGFLTTSA